MAAVAVAAAAATSFKQSLVVRVGWLNCAPCSHLKEIQLFGHFAHNQPAAKWNENAYVTHIQHFVVLSSNVSFSVQIQTNLMNI